MISSLIETQKRLQFLDRLGAMSEAELMENYTNETISSIRMIASELNENLDLEHILSERRFIEVVRDLAEIKAIWAQRLEETVKLAEKAVEGGKEMQAHWILDGFIRFCPSPYFRGIVENYMDEV